MEKEDDKMNFELASMMEKLTDIVSQMDQWNDNLQLLVFNNRNLKNEIDVLKTENNSLVDSIIDIEKRLLRSDQYSRRENLEIMNLPESISQRELERTVIDIFNSVNINICSYNIVAVHRIGRNNRLRPRNVIIRFINRKDSIRIFNRRKQIETSAKNIFNMNGLRIIENLCPENKLIFNKCFKLKKLGKIDYVSSVNGNVYIQMPDYENELLIEHFDDIEYYLNEDPSIIYDELHDTFNISNNTGNNISNDGMIS